MAYPAHVPDWMETTVAAALAAAFAARPRGRTTERERTAAEVEQLAEALTKAQRVIRHRLVAIVDDLVPTVDESLRAPPSPDGHPIGTAIAAALDLLRQRTGAAREDRLELRPERRRSLAAAVKDLRVAALDAGLDEIDPPMYDAITWLARGRRTGRRHRGRV